MTTHDANSERSMTAAPTSGPFVSGEQTALANKRALLAADEIETLLGPHAALTAIEQRSSDVPQAQNAEADVESNDGGDPPGASSADAWNAAERMVANLSGTGAASSIPPNVQSFRLRDLAAEGDKLLQPPSGWNASDVLDLRIELGRTHLPADEAQRLRKGTVVPLDGLAREPVDIVVNDQLIGRGEALIIDGKFCVRVLELAASPMAKAS